MKINQKKAGVILSYLSESIKILSGLIYTPIMLRILGQSEYGLYQLVHSVVSYLGLLSLGFGSSYMRFYSRFKVNDDEEGIARLNGMFMVIFCSISAICLICGMIMTGNITSIFGKGLTSEEYNKARILMILMVINLALTFPNSVFNCNVTAHEKFLFQKLLITLQQLLNPFLTLPLLLLGYGSVGMVTITTILTFAVLISNAFYCFNILKIKFIFYGFQFSLLKEMWVFTFFIFLNQIIDQVNYSVDKFLLGRMDGTTAVAIYGVGGTINTMYIQFSTSIANVFVPKVNRVVAAKGKDTELTKIMTRIGRIQFMILALILTGFFFFGKAFVRFWAGDGYSEAYYVTLLLIAPAIVPLIQNLGIEIQRAKNKHRTRSVVYFFIAICNILISIPLIKIMGPTGAALGTAVALVLGNIIFMNWYYHARIGLDMLFFWKNILAIVPATIPAIVVGILINWKVSYSRFLYLLIGILVYTVVYSVSLYLFGMNDSEKLLLAGPIYKVLNRRK